MTAATALLIQHGVPLILAGMAQAQRKRAIEELHADGVLPDAKAKELMDEAVDELIDKDPIGSQD